MTEEDDENFIPEPTIEELLARINTLESQLEGVTEANRALHIDRRALLESMVSERNLRELAEQGYTVIGDSPQDLPTHSRSAGPGDEEEAVLKIRWSDGPLKLHARKSVFDQLGIGGAVEQQQEYPPRGFWMEMAEIFMPMAMFFFFVFIIILLLSALGII
jgi:hypothetical protein